MAEPRRPVIRIKVGGKAIQAAAGGAVKRQLQQLGYPEPNASLQVLEEVLKLNSYPCGIEYPAWDQLTAELGFHTKPAACSCSGVDAKPCALHPCQRLRSAAGQPPVKRQRVEAAVQLQERASSKASQIVLEHGQDEHPLPILTTSSCKSPKQVVDCLQPGDKMPNTQEPGELCNAPVNKESALLKEDLGATGVQSSASDQATTCALSPTEVTAALAAGQPVQLPSSVRNTMRVSDPVPIILLPPQPKDMSNSNVETTQQALVHEQLQPHNKSVSQGHPQAPVNGCSVAVQTHNPHSFLPCTLLQPPYQTHHSAAAGSTAQPSHTNFCFPPQHSYLCVPNDLINIEASEANLQALVDKAKQLKRQGDSKRGTGPWTYAALQFYVESALVFMTAIECMLRMPQTPECTSKAVRLCLATADFLLFTVSAVEKLPGNSLTRDCLRSLCERLAALCLLKECGLSAGKYKEYADRLDRWIARNPACMQERGPVMRKGIPSNVGSKTDRISPDNSHASSADRITAAAAMQRPGIPSHNTTVVPPFNLPPDMTALQSKLVEGARQMARFVDLVRKSVSSFTVLLEREEVRRSEEAMQACSHIAALCLGGGYVDGVRVIAHGYQALKCLQAL